LGQSGLLPAASTYQIYDTLIGSNEVQAAEDPSSYWRLGLKDPALE
jgi:hypothetical protein